MRLGEARQTYYEASGTASTIARQLGFAGIGIIFTFRNESASKQVPRDLVPAAILIVAALAFDLLQYLVRTIVWGRFARVTEQQMEDALDDALVSAPDWINRPPIVLFALKMLAMGAAYGYLLKFLFGRVF